MRFGKWEVRSLDRTGSKTNLSETGWGGMDGLL
jgi:hypothetical protein